MARGRSMMTMRTRVTYQDSSGARDPDGQPITVEADRHAALPCYVWGRQERTVVNGENVAVFTTYKAIAPHDSGVQEGDEFTELRDRRDSYVVDDGGDATLVVRAVTRWPGAFLDLSLEQIHGTG